ncbi:hypothetical protein [Hymenobacter agri]
MKPINLFYCFLLAAAPCFAQSVIGLETVPEKQIRKWLVASPRAYAGSYHFGFSENESSLTIQVNDGKVSAVLERYFFDSNGQARQTAKAFTHIRIIGNSFLSDQAKGDFVAVGNGRNTSLGLRISNPWSRTIPNKHREIGIRSLQP